MRANTSKQSHRIPLEANSFHIFRLDLRQVRDNEWLESSVLPTYFGRIYSGKRNDENEQHSRLILSAWLREHSGRRLRILAQYEETCCFFGHFRILTARCSKKITKKKSRYTGHDLIFGAFSLFYQDYTKRDGNFKSRPISLAPTLARFWKAETISYIRVASFL